MNATSEFELIRRHFACGYPQADGTLLGIGDDCSLIAPPQGMVLTQSIDTQVSDVHFPKHAPAHLIAERALRCATSDLAAMGATAHSFHLALTLPSANEVWLQGFADGLRHTAKQFNMALLGGDTTRGEQLVISIMVQGWLPANRALTRGNANVDDDVWLSGKVGGSALVLPKVLANPALDDDTSAPYYHPTVHLGLGQALMPFASAAIDISDGLLQDAEHIATRSQVTLELLGESIPTAVASDHPQWQTCLTGGDDYQLLFCSAPEHRQAIENLPFPTFKIGQVHYGTSKVRLLLNQQEIIIPARGFQHF